MSTYVGVTDFQKTVWFFGQPCIFKTEQLQIGNWVETTKLSCLVTNSVHTADMDKTR